MQRPTRRRRIGGDVHHDSAGDHTEVEEVIDDQVDDPGLLAPAKSDQASMLMVRADFVDSIAAARVSPNATCPRTSKHQLSQGAAVTMKQWHEVMAC